MADEVSGRARSGRSLKTAAEALTALRILGATREGVTADSLAAELGKSPATARYLLNTLCQEGFAAKDGGVGSYRLTADPPWGATWGEPVESGRPELPAMLSDAVTELHRRTRQHTYLARWDSDATVIVDALGHEEHEDVADVPDLSERIPMASAHALAVTKALLACSDDLEDMVARDSELVAFTGTTITTAPDLHLELARVRRDGYAVDREEYAEGVCSVGAPIMAPDGRVAASIAISTPAHRFAFRTTELTDAVRDVAVTATRSWRTGEQLTGARPSAGPRHRPSDTGPGRR